MLSVRSLLDEFGLELAVGGKAEASPIRWVHISELQDPTPFLSGGELLLTTGIISRPPPGSASSSGCSPTQAPPDSASARARPRELPKALVEEAE